MEKILVGVVTHGKKHYALSPLMNCLTKQTVPVDILFVVANGQDAFATLIRSKNKDYVTVVENPEPAPTSAEAVVSGRNYIRNFALKNDYDRVLFVDSDVMVPGLAAELLLHVDAEVVSGAYLDVFSLGGRQVIAPVLFKDIGKGECQLFKYEAAALPQIMDIGAAGLGCTMVKKKVLEKVKFRCFNKEKKGTDAMAFYVDAREHGFSCKAHTGVKCLHLPFPLTDKRAKVFEWKATYRSATKEINLV